MVDKVKDVKEKVFRDDEKDSEGREDVAAGALV